MAFLKPDKIIKVSIGNGTITINQKITPDGVKSGNIIGL